jgi:hypothetical protein
MGSTGILRETLAAWNGSLAALRLVAGPDSLRIDKPDAQRLTRGRRAAIEFIARSQTDGRYSRPYGLAPGSSTMNAFPLGSLYIAAVHQAMAAHRPNAANSLWESAPLSKPQKAQDDEDDHDRAGSST